MRKLWPVLLILPAVLSACGQRPDRTPSAAARIYGADCRICHGPGGRGGVENPLLHRTIPALRSEKWAEPGASSVLRSIIREGSLPDGRKAGVVAMPGWQGYLSPAEIDSVVRYLQAGLPGPVPAPPVDAAGLYRQAGCLGCHGKPGAGGGLAPAIPRDRSPAFYLGPLLAGSFGPGKDGWLPAGPGLMPALGRLMEPPELWSLLGYLQTGRNPKACPLPKGQPKKTGWRQNERNLPAAGIEPRPAGQSYPLR